MTDAQNTSAAIVPIKKKRSPRERESDLPLVARHYIRGVPLSKIGELVQQEHYPGFLPLTPEMVAADVKIIRQRWLESTLIDFNEVKAQELAHLEHLENAYWEAWEASVHVRTAEEETTADVEVVTRAGLVVPTHNTTTIIKRDPGLGNPAYLQGIERCIQKRCQILGLFSPEVHQIDWRVEARGIWSQNEIDDVKERAVNLFMEAIEKAEREEKEISADSIIEGEFTM